MILAFAGWHFRAYTRDISKHFRDPHSPVGLQKNSTSAQFRNACWCHFRPEWPCGKSQRTTLTIVWHMFLGVFRVKETIFVVILHLASSILAVAPPGEGAFGNFSTIFYKLQYPSTTHSVVLAVTIGMIPAFLPSISANGVARMRNGGGGKWQNFSTYSALVSVNVAG